jgi:hypothetical protein
MTSHFKARLACKCATADKARRRTRGESGEREDESALHAAAKVVKYTNPAFVFRAATPFFVLTNKFCGEIGLNFAHSR